MRKLATGLAGALVLLSIFGFWSYMAHVAVLEQNAPTFEDALAALDNQEYELAKQIIGKLKLKRSSIEDVGGYLFVLGAYKAHQANLEWSEDRRRATHLMAARYLQKSRELGPPPGRQQRLMYLLGRSLIAGNQHQEGIEVLRESLVDTSTPSAKTHQLLAEAYSNLPNPDLKAALYHNRSVMTDTSMDEGASQVALLAQADILIRLNQLDEAEAVLAKLGSKPEHQSMHHILAGRLALAKASRETPNSEQRDALIETALGELRTAQRLDTLNGEITRQAMVSVGKCLELRNETAAAIEQYERVGNSYGDTPESIVATLYRARLLQDSQQPDKALVGYRRVLESAGNPHTYANPLLPLALLRKYLLEAHSIYVDNRQFEQAMALLDHGQRLLGAVQVASLQGLTHVAWGEDDLRESQNTHRRRSAQSLESEGRYHFRAAGRSFETLARLRHASARHTDDLWSAAENYYRGHSFTHAAQVLDQYLLQESRNRRAVALLRYGQSQLANGNTADAITAFEECIELHPRDANVFAARVECSRAYLIENESQKAEALLRANLTGDTLRPESPEWRDSLFLLGTYLHDVGRYEEAIEILQEAVARYPDDPQTLLARYTIARAYHEAAEAPAQIAIEAKTENERQKNRLLRDDYLESALANYRKVQQFLSLENQNEETPFTKTLLRNCYMMQGSVLFQLRRYDDARKAYANVSTIYQNEPFVLESFVHIANCWHRLNQSLNARQTIAQAKLVLNRIPGNVDFKESTNFSRQQWELLLGEMEKW